MTFEELQAVFTGKNIDVSLLEETPLDNASYFGRIFARSGGLTEALKQGKELLDMGTTDVELFKYYGD